MLFNNYLNNGLIVPCLSHGLNCKQTAIEYLNNGISVRYSTHDLALSYKVRNLNGSVIRILTVVYFIEEVNKISLVAQMLSQKSGDTGFFIGYKLGASRSASFMEIYPRNNGL